MYQAKVAERTATALQRAWTGGRRRVQLEHDCAERGTAADERGIPADLPAPDGGPTREALLRWQQPMGMVQKPVREVAKDGLIETLDDAC